MLLVALLAGGQPSLSGVFHWTDLVPAAAVVAAIIGSVLVLEFVGCFTNQNANPS